MANWTDGVNVETASVNATVETQIGTNINIPQGQTWNIRSMWVGHAGLGTYRISVDTLPAMRGEYVVTATDATTKNTTVHTVEEMVNYSVAGPSIVKFFITPDAASATAAIANLKYQVTSNPVRNG